MAMTQRSDNQLRAQMSLYYDFLKTVADQGDQYAKLLQGIEDPYPAY
jgi:hypothetical protein